MKIAVLGLGIIGSAWANNLSADGHEVRAWNRTPQPDFPGFVPDAGDAVEGADFVFLVVADPPAVESVLSQILPRLQNGAMLVQCSTISPHWTLEFARRTQESGALFLEAPFSGSKVAAQQRQSVFYVGGDEALTERARPVLEPLSKAILHIGPLGKASALKLAMNVNIAGIAQTLSESLELARHCGLSDEIFFDALEANIAKSGVSALKAPNLRSGDYEPQFSLKHLEKDLRLSLETAQETGAQMPQTQKLRELYLQGMEKGWGDDDFIGLIRLIQK